MPNENTGAAADAAGATGAAGAASTTQQQADAGAAGQGQKGEAFVNKAEVVEYFKRTQKLEEQNKTLLAELAQLKGGGKADATATAGEQKKTEQPSETQQLRRELALEKAIGAHKLNDKQVSVLQRLVAAENPSDVVAFVAATVADLGWKDAASGQGAQQQRQIRTDLGASGRQDGAQPPDDWTQMDPATWKSLTPEERRKRVDAHKRASGYSGGTFRKPLPSR